MKNSLSREKFVSKQGFKPQITSFTHWRSTTESLRQSYQLRIKPFSYTSTQHPQNVMHAFTILRRATQQLGT